MTWTAACAVPGSCCRALGRENEGGNAIAPAGLREAMGWHGGAFPEAVALLLCEGELPTSVPFVCVPNFVHVVPRVNPRSCGVRAVCAFASNEGPDDGG